MLRFARVERDGIMTNRQGRHSGADGAPDWADDRENAFARRISWPDRPLPSRNARHGRRGTRGRAGAGNRVRIDDWCSATGQQAHVPAVRVRAARDTMPAAEASARLGRAPAAR